MREWQQEQGHAPVLSYDFSLAVALLTGAVPHFCYANAWHALLACPDLQEASLVEGWIVLEQPTQVTLIEHGWCEYAGHLILDPSLVLLMKRTQPVLYVPGVCRDRAEVQRLSCADLPLVRSVGTYGPDGMGHPAYRAAYAAAHEQAMKLVEASAPPKRLIVQPCVAPQTDHLTLGVRVISSLDVGRGAR